MGGAGQSAPDATWVCPNSWSLLCPLSRSQGSSSFRMVVLPRQAVLAGLPQLHSGIHTCVVLCFPTCDPLAGEVGDEEEKEPLPSLDVFLSRYTSEDNASFQEIMEVAKEKSHARHAWLYQAEEEFEKVFGNISTFFWDGVPGPQVQGAFLTLPSPHVL